MFDKRDCLVAVVNEDAILPYDLLVLICGEQFQRPKVLQNETKGLFRAMHAHKKTKDLPDNLFIINTYLDATMCLNKLNPPKTRFEQNRKCHC